VSPAITLIKKFLCNIINKHLHLNLNLFDMLDGTSTSLCQTDSFIKGSIPKTLKKNLT
jgi:hypothetical protein